MGSTTRYGRTRNRRGLQPPSAPDGYPNMLILGAVVRVSSTVFRFPLYDINGVNNQYDSMVITGPLNLWLDEDAENRECTVTYDGVTKLLTITLPTPINDGVLPIIRPWQPTVRGPNGEWVAPTVFDTGAD